MAIIRSGLAGLVGGVMRKRGVDKGVEDWLGWSKRRLVIIGIGHIR
jgi:hypothetical protein